MPVKSKTMWKMIQAKRSKYKTKAKTPKKEKWIWEKDWFENVDYKSLPNKVDESIESIQDYENQFGIVKKSFDSNTTLSFLKGKEKEMKNGGLIRSIDVPSITVGLGEEKTGELEESKRFSFKEETEKLLDDNKSFELYELVSEHPQKYKLIQLAKNADDAFKLAKQKYNEKPIAIVYRKSKSIKYPKFFVINTKIYRLPDFITYSFGHEG